MPSHPVTEHLEFWTSLPEPPGEFVYVVQAIGDTPIKVGRAVNVRKRIASLQTGNPRKLELLHVVPGGSHLEWQLHRRPHGHRLVGEWFDGEQIPRFLEFVGGLAQFMVDGYAEAGSVPSFRAYGSGWQYKGQAPAVVSYVDPDPEAVARAAELRKREEEPQEFVASERDKAHFKRGESEPIFSPHRPR